MVKNMDLKKYNRSKMISIVVMSFASFSVFGACHKIACDSTVKQLYASSAADGTVFIVPNDSLQLLNCRPVSNRYLSLKSTHPLFDQIYSMLLAAVVSKLQVRVRIVEGSTDCEVAYAWINAL